MSNIDLAFDTHRLKCPHCMEEIVHSWPGCTIPFSSAKCDHCGRAFLIVLNEPRPTMDRDKDLRASAN